MTQIVDTNCLLSRVSASQVAGFGIPLTVQVQLAGLIKSTKCIYTAGINHNWQDTCPFYLLFQALDDLCGLIHYFKTTNKSNAEQGPFLKAPTMDMKPAYPSACVSLLNQGKIKILP